MLTPGLPNPIRVWRLVKSGATTLETSISASNSASISKMLECWSLLAITLNVVDSKGQFLIITQRPTQSTNWLRAEVPFSHDLYSSINFDRQDTLFIGLAGDSNVALGVIRYSSEFRIVKLLRHQLKPNGWS